MHLQGAGEMDGVESPQRAALSKVSGTLRDLRRQLDHDEMSEIAIECGNSTSERRASCPPRADGARARPALWDTRHARSQPWRQRRVGTSSRPFRPRARRASPARSCRDTGSAAILDYGVRDGTTADARRVVEANGLAASPRDPAALYQRAYDRIRPLARSRWHDDRDGPIPVGHGDHPRRTRASVALNLSLSCRTPICVFATTSRSARPG